MLRDFSQLPNRHQTHDHFVDDCRLKLRRLSQSIFGLAFTDISITVANVATVSGGISRGEFNASTTLTAGMVVYLTASNTWAKAGNTTATLAGGVAPNRVGFALHAALSGQPLSVQESGTITVGGTLTVGTLYCVSVNVGALAPFSDLATTNKINILGIATSATVLDMSYKSVYAGGYSAVAVP